MYKDKIAIITGADGGMGMEITRAVALKGYQVIMVCRDPKSADIKRMQLIKDTQNSSIKIGRAHV